MSRPIEFPSPRGSTWLNPDFVMSVAPPTGPGVLYPDRHCLALLITGATVALPYSAAAAVAALFGGEPPTYEVCCPFHDPSRLDALPCPNCTASGTFGPYGHDDGCPLAAVAR